MFYYWGYNLSYILFLAPAFIFLVVAQVMVKSSFSKYSKTGNYRAMTGAMAAQAVLDQNGVTGVRIEAVAGNLTDHYDPKMNVIRLSEQVFNSASIAAVGVAAHEAGHAVQYAENYGPIKLRMAVLPLARFGPMLTFPLMVAGYWLNMIGLVYAGIILFGFALLFQMITLPVEFNASSRAMAAINNASLLTPDEAKGARNVLTAAAMTYVAAMFQSLLQLIWFILQAQRRR